jgi:hypothetical protein
MCPFCGDSVRPEHTCIVYATEDGKELWACDGCLDKMPEDGTRHWMECAECQETDDGCPECQRIEAEYDRIMNPVFATWEEMVTRISNADWHILYNDGAAMVYHVDKHVGLIAATRGDMEKLKHLEVFIPAEVVDD